jgi:ABC-type Zn uptake system ZnuABC Zn-binding protein ZnuA
MKAENAHVILVQPFQNRKTAETVARQTDAQQRAQLDLLGHFETTCLTAPPRPRVHWTV